MKNGYRYACIANTAKNKLQNQDGAEVIHVGTRRTADNQVTECAEETITIIVLQHGFRVQALLGCAGP